MEVENVARVGFTSGRTADKQRESAVGDGVLREVVVYNENVLPAVHEIFADGAARVGGDVLERGGFGSGRRDDDSVVHGAVFVERVDDVCDGGLFLTDRDVDADAVFAALVQDRVGRDDGFACLAVADNELALAAADRNHGVDGLDAGLERHGNGFALDNAVRAALDRAVLGGVNRTFRVDWLAESVHDAADERLADRNRDDAAGALDDAALADTGVASEKNRADEIFLEVERHSERAVRELEEFVRLALFEAVDLRDAVADGNNVADFVLLDLAGVVSDLFLYYFADVVNSGLHRITNFNLSVSSAVAGK